MARPRMRLLTAAGWVALAGGTAALVAVLSLSDRAPGMIRGLLSPLVATAEGQARSRGLDAPPGYDLATTYPDAFAHLLLWGAVAVVFGTVTSGHRTRWLVLAPSLFVASVVVEELQLRWSSSRAFDGLDVAANGVGIAVGTLVATVMVAVVDRSSLGRT